MTANLLQALYLASFVSGAVSTLHWIRGRSAEGDDARSHRQRFRGWLIATMTFSGLAAALYFVVTRA
ncbi:MAG: hypothetical protein KY464_11380 [Gemmatimonadetes bacterium]|nr:hypothetical protein [Gemmatimonadota bacterium]